MSAAYDQEVITAIYAAFTNDTDLSAAVSGGLWNPDAPQGTDMPYGIYFIVSDVPDRWNAGSAQAESILVQFNYYTTGANTVLTDIFNKHCAVFDEWNDDGTYGDFRMELERKAGPLREPETKILSINMDFRVWLVGPS